VTAGFLALAIGAAWFVRQWFQEMDGRMTQLTHAVETAAQDARRAAAEASLSAAAAQTAQSMSRTAAQERDEAMRQTADAKSVATEAVRNAEQARAEAEEMRKQRDQELSRLQQTLDRIVETRRTAFGLVMNLPDSALRFEFNSASLGSQARETLSRIAGILMTSGSYGLEVHGHTDFIGSDEYNQQLSQRRAEAVRNYIVSAGIDPNIITVKGFGKSSPVASGRDDASRAKNRRVEIAVTDSSIRYKGEAVQN
jgi:outer membrane protein OmpA-like peptidoglycan-associated protein